MAPTQAQKNYIRDEIQNASPQKLIVMLYDKAIKSLEEAKKNIQNENQFYFADNIIKAEKIIAELMGALKAEVAPELVLNLTRLYEFMYQHLVKAHDEKSEEKIEQVLTLMRDLRQTWVDAIEKAKDEEPLEVETEVQENKPRPSFTLQA
jgi:flagellar protein FliS